MQLENSFRVDAPAGLVFAALQDVERVTPCLPGARLIEQLGDDRHAIAVKVKVGPVAMEYRGQVEIGETDPENRRLTIAAKAREIRGQGSASADIALTVADDGGASTAAIVSDVRVTGRVASMGQGVIADVAERLLGQFAANLAHMLDGPGEDSGDDAGDARQGPATTDPSAPAAAPRRSPPAASDTSDGGEISVLPLLLGMLRERFAAPGVVTPILLAAFAFLAGRWSR